MHAGLIQPNFRLAPRYRPKLIIEEVERSARSRVCAIYRKASRHCRRINMYAVSRGTCLRKSYVESLTESLVNLNESLELVYLVLRENQFIRACAVFREKKQRGRRKQYHTRNAGDLDGRIPQIAREIVLAPEV